MSGNYRTCRATFCQPVRTVERQNSIINRLHGGDWISLCKHFRSRTERESFPAPGSAQRSMFRPFSRRLKDFCLPKSFQQGTEISIRLRRHPSTRAGASSTEEVVIKMKLSNLNANFLSLSFIKFPSIQLSVCLRSRGVSREKLGGNEKNGNGKLISLFDLMRGWWIFRLNYNFEQMNVDSRTRANNGKKNFFRRPKRDLSRELEKLEFLMNEWDFVCDKFHDIFRVLDRVTVSCQVNFCWKMTNFSQKLKKLDFFTYFSLSHFSL